MDVRIWAGLALIGAVGMTGCGDDDSSDDAATDTTRPATTIPAVASTAPPAVAVTVAETVATTVADTVAESTADTVADSAAGTAQDASVPFEDPFDDDRNGWGIIDDPQFGTAQFEDGDYAWSFTGRIAHWVPAVLGEQYDRGELEMLDVTVRADVTVDAGGGVVGVFCRETPDTDADWQWYEFVARDGYAAIRRADTESNFDVLAETEDVVAPLGAPLAIEGTCVDDDGQVQLTMTLDGEPVLNATDDDPLGNGLSGLQTWTFPVHDRIDVRWHGFSVVAAAV